MNHIYRSIWNDKTGAFVAVPENAKSAGKKSTPGATAVTAVAHFVRKGLAVSLSLMLAFSSNIYALPTGGAVSAGSASIAGGAGKTTITQSSQSAAINWQSFNIAPGEVVRFVQPNSSSVLLNRVLGSDPSSILGSLLANGNVFLVNPNGILFGKGAQVNVGGLVASTLNITDGDFMAGRYNFAGAGNGTILNQGSINADGGYVALLGANVSNQGVISAKLGTVALAAGNAVTLDMAGDGLLNVSVNQGAVNALVQNGGLIQADGGQVLLTAQAAGNLLQSAVNNTGVIQAQTIENHKGTIRLLGDMQSGTVSVGGTLDASAPNGGNGGFIETSAAHVKVADNTIVTTQSAQGKSGTWLIDPVDYTIAATAGDITGAQLSANLDTGNVTILSSSGAVGVNGDINVNDVVNWSANQLTLDALHNININSTMTGTGTASLSLLYGQATVTSGNTSTYYVLAPVNLPAGPNFTTQLGSNGVPTNYTVITSLGSEGSATGTDLQGMNGNRAGYYALGSNIDATPTGTTWSAAGFDPVGQTIATPFTGNFDGLGHTITGLTILRPLTNNVGLFGYVDNFASPDGARLRNVTLAGGSVEGGSYVGNLAGHITGDITNSHTTQAATGSISGGSYVGGLVGWSTGNISYSSATAAPVTGHGDYVGGLVGWITGNIDCCWATGPVTSTGSYVGGLVGWITGSISRSYATGIVNTAALYVGGLVGWILGDTSNSYALGDVTTAGGNVGGLVGRNDGTISNSFSAGKVSGAVPVGGLVGFSNSGDTVTNSFWDLTTSLQPLSAGGAGAKGMPTTEMQKEINFTTDTLANAPLHPRWDFTNIWVMVNDGTTYPSLQVCLVPVIPMLVTTTTAATTTTTAAATTTTAAATTTTAAATTTTAAATTTTAATTTSTAGPTTTTTVATTTTTTVPWVVVPPTVPPVTPILPVLVVVPPVTPPELLTLVPPVPPVQLAPVVVPPVTPPKVYVPPPRPRKLYRN